MPGHLDRRTFLKSAGTMAVAAGTMAAASGALSAEPEAKGAPHAAKLGWRLGCQAWTFNDTTFFDAISKTASLGLHYIEAFPGQKLSAAKPKVPVGERLSADERKEIKQRLSDSGVTMTSLTAGLPARAMMTSSPLSTAAMSLERLVLA